MTDDELSKILSKDATQPQLPGIGEKLTDWKNEPSLLDLKANFEAAKPSHTSQMTKIRKWQDLTSASGSARPPKIKGRSSVQPKLIRRQAEWRYSALSEPFLSSDKLFTIEPVTFEDVAAARQNELVLNNQFRTKIDRVKLIDDYVRTNVDEGTAIARLGWKRSSVMVKKMVPVFEYLPMVSPDGQMLVPEEELQAFQQALEMKAADPRTFSEQMPPEIQAAVEYFEESQIPTTARIVGEEEVEEEKILENHPTVEILNPANVYIDPTCNGDLDKALFVIVSFETNRAELLKEQDRYKNLDKVHWETSTINSQPDHVIADAHDFQFKDDTRKKVVAYEYWGYYDIEKNGTLKPIVATWIGETLIRMEENPFPDGKVPFVISTYLPIKRELYGEPDAELLEDNQKILGAVTRGMIDLLGQSANGQKGIPKGMLDPMNKRRFENGQDYEYILPGVPPHQAMITHTYPAIPDSALLMVNLQNQEAESLTGVKSFSGGMSGDVYGKVATGIKGMLDAAAKREMGILRRLAKGITQIGRKILAMNSEFLSEKEVIRITNTQYVTVNREELAGEFDLTVDISTYEVDNTKAQDLGFMLQTLGPNMDPTISMKLLAEIAELKRMPALAQDLRTWQPQPDPMAEQLKQLELQKAQMEIQLLQSEIQLNQAKAHQAVATGDLKELERVEQETGTKHARNIVETQAQARGNMNLETLKAIVKGRKPEEKAPNIDAAIGYNELSDALEKERLLGPNPPANPGIL